ncbi:MAG: hypothetical protein R3247_01545 [Rhodothermales bacterium]|nr:hypothetical protein [Rhodothermales bacterium]
MPSPLRPTRSGTPEPRSEEPSARPEPPPPATAANYWDYCPNCGARLHNAGCKYRCPDCHYFMSCSDFD